MPAVLIRDTIHTMKVVAVVLAAVLFVTAQLPMGVSFDPVVPSFLWSPHQHRSDGVESVNYKTLSPKDLAKSVMSEGGWSNLLVLSSPPCCRILDVHLPPSLTRTKSSCRETKAYLTFISAQGRELNSIWILGLFLLGKR
nr:Guanine nucleotide-binding protein alpha-4 subunit like [Ipomoea batatas]